MDEIASVKSKIVNHRDLDFVDRALLVKYFSGFDGFRDFRFVDNFGGDFFAIFVRELGDEDLKCIMNDTGLVYDFTVSHDGGFGYVFKL